VVADVQGTPPGGGWFPDPAGSPYLRWWDGSAWTDHFIDATTGAPPRELPVAASSVQQATTGAQAETPAAAVETPADAAPAATAAASPEAATSAATSIATGAAGAAGLFPVAEPTPAFADVATPVPSVTPVVEPAAVSPAASEPELPVSASAAPTDGAPLTRRQLREQEERQSLENFSPAVAAPESGPVAAPTPTAFSFDPVPATPQPMTPEQTAAEQTAAEQTAAEPITPEPMSPEPTMPERAPYSFDLTPVPAVPEPTPASFEATPFSFSAGPVAAEPTVAEPAVAEPAVPEPSPFTFGQTPVPAVPDPANTGPSPFTFGQTPVPAVPESTTPEQAVVPAASADPFGGTMPPPAMPTIAQQSPFQPTPFQPTQQTPFQPAPAQSNPAQPASDAAPTSWPFVTGFDGASGTSSAGVASAPAPFSPSSAGSVPSSWLGAPPPQPSDAYALPGQPGTAAASAAETAEPMTRSRQRQSEEHFGGDDGVPTSSTWAVWVFAALPILHFGLVYLLYIATKPTDDTYRFAVLLGPIVIYLVLAVVDRSILARAGHETLPSPLLAIIPPLYLGFRVTRVGRSSLPQLITWFVLQAVMIAVLVLVFPTQFSQLTSGTTAATSTVITPAKSTTITAAQRATELTPAGMQSALTKQFLTQGISLTSVTCPPLPDKNDKTQVTCKGVMSSGNLDIVVAVDSALKTSAFDIVSSAPPAK
jgi:hypothetical protein